jgi:CDP-diacylglycerol---glycerol-3-phosphate 3-phosphatidyltransferase
MFSLPNIVTITRIFLIPMFVIVYYLPFAAANRYAMYIFIFAALTDWLDGYLARRLNQFSHFGAFLDPVADKLMVSVALLLLLSDPRVHELSWNLYAFVVAIIIIISREISMSALREWMAKVGKYESVAVSVFGKIKTAAQMIAIPFLLYQKPLWGLPVFHIGEALLYFAALLTLWSMVSYLRSAWPNLTE